MSRSASKKLEGNDYSYLFYFGIYVKFDIANQRLDNQVNFCSREQLECRHLRLGWLTDKIKISNSVIMIINGYKFYLLFI